MSDLLSLWRRLTTPASADEDTARREYMTRVILVMMVMTMLAFSLPVFLGWILGHYALVDAVTILMSDALVLTALWLAQRGQWRISRYIPLLIIFFLASLITATNGLLNTGLLFYAVAILLASMLIGIKAQWAMVALSIIAYLLLGGLYEKTSFYFLSTVAITVSSTLVGIALLQWLLVNQLQQALQRARLSTEKLEHHTVELIELNRELQQEINERERAEKLLRESEERYRTLFQNAPVGLGLADLSGNLLDFNAAMLAPGGYTSQDITEIGNVAALYYDPEERKQVLKKATEQGFLRQHEVRFRRKDGSPYDSLLSLTPVTIEGRTCWQAMVEDITERKRARKRIQRQLENMSALRTVDMTITASMDLRFTLDVLLSQIIGTLGIDAVTILTYKPQIQTLDYAARRGFRTGALQHTHLRLGDGNAGRAALKRQIIHIPNLNKVENDLERSPEFPAENFVVYIGVPLIAKGQVKGVLEIFNRSSLNPDQEWMDLLKAFAAQAAIAIDNSELFRGLQQSNQDLLMAYEFTLEGWAKALELRDAETQGHTQRVTEMTIRLARALGVGEEHMIHIRRGTLLHDIGKMGIPDSILLKPGPLTEEEWEIMRQHPVYAHQLLSPIPYLRPAADIPYCHHEKWDGTGYPRGLKGEQIPLAARIFAVVDVWDALSSDRPYRDAWPEDKILEYLKEQSGLHFDPAVLEAFLNLL